MEELDPIDMIAISVTLIGIVVGLIQLSKAGRRNNAGSFFCFKLENDRRDSLVITRMSQICGLLSVALFFIGFALTYHNDVSELSRRNAFLLFESTIISITSILSTFLNQILGLKDFKRIDGLIKDGEIIDLVEIVSLLCTAAIPLLCSIVFGLNLTIFGAAETIVAIVTLVLCVFIGFALFIRSYFEMRTLYAVADTKIILKGADCEYSKIHGYRYHRGNLILIHDDNGILKKTQTDESNVLLIEQVIDLKTTLKDIKLSTETKKRDGD